ncbi:unnamed protein product [Auanema sp. JU1783]|nr:unnamed protein product [Auanema sp. JU1783]
MDNSCHRRERTIYVSMLPENVTDDDLYRLFLEAGPIEKVIFKQNLDGTPQHALIVFRRVESVKYASLNLIKCISEEQPLHIRPLKESSHHLLPFDNFRKPSRDSFSSFPESPPIDDDFRGYRLWHQQSQSELKPINHWNNNSHNVNPDNAKHRPRPFNLSQSHQSNKDFWKNERNGSYRAPPFSAGLIGLGSARSAFPLFYDDSLQGTTFNKKHMNGDKLSERLNEHCRTDSPVLSPSFSFSDVDRFYSFAEQLHAKRESTNTKAYTNWSNYQGTPYDSIDNSDWALENRATPYLFQFPL